MDGPPLLDPSALARLSSREEQVLRMASDGLLDKQIAIGLGITENTLRTYWRRIRAKVGEAPRGALAALYAKTAVADGIKEEGEKWSVDLRRSVVVYESDLGFLHRGETDLSRAIEIYVPEDRERIRDLLRAMSEREMPEVTYIARVLTPYGVETTCSVVRQIRDPQGKLLRLEGRHIALLDLTSDADGAAMVGTYRRDLDTGKVTIDEGLATIFRIDPSDPHLFDTVIGRFCPEFRKAMRGMVDGMIVNGNRQRRWTARLCFGGGESLWVSSQSRLEMQDSRPVAFVATVVAHR